MRIALAGLGQVEHSGNLERTQPQRRGTTTSNTCSRNLTRHNASVRVGCSLVGCIRRGLWARLFRDGRDEISDGNRDEIRQPIHGAMLLSVGWPLGGAPSTQGARDSQVRSGPEPYLQTEPRWPEVAKLQGLATWPLGHFGLAGCAGGNSRGSACSQPHAAAPAALFTLARQVCIVTLGK